MTVMVTIGNSDDKLTQEEWNKFSHETKDAIDSVASLIHGEFYSLPHRPWQNACWIFELTGNKEENEFLADRLSLIGGKFKQESIAYAVFKTEFIEPSGKWITT